MASQIFTSSASTVDALVLRDENYTYAAGFRLRGREYVRASGVGGSTFFEGGADLKVWNSAGRLTTVRVRDTDKIEILSRQ